MKIRIVLTTLAVLYGISVFAEEARFDFYHSGFYVGVDFIYPPDNSVKLYTWFLNGTVCYSGGVEAYGYTFPSLKNGDQVTVSVTTQKNNVYHSPIWYYGGNPNEPIGEMSISTSTVIHEGSPKFCTNKPYTFQASPYGENIEYTWYRNGIYIASGRVFTSQSLSEGDLIKVRGKRGTQEAYAQTTVQLLSLESPSLMIRNLSGNDVCDGGNIRFSVSSSGTGTNPVYVWSKNNISLHSSGSSEYTATGVNNNDVISVSVNGNLCYNSVTKEQSVTMKQRSPVWLYSLPSVCNWEQLTLSIQGAVDSDFNSIQWNCNGTDVSQNVKKLGGAHYSIDNFNPGQAAVFTCQIIPSAEACIAMQTNTINVELDATSCNPDNDHYNNYDHYNIRQRVVQVKNIKSKNEIADGNALTSYSYFDGLGRLLQIVEMNASPGKEDIVTPVVYDILGRENRQYLPYIVDGKGAYQSDALTDQNAFYTTAPKGISSDKAPYSETFFEPSSLNRIVKQYGPGQAWKEGHHFTGIRYETNTINYVLLWKVIATGATCLNGNTRNYYNEGSLHCIRTTDEDGNVSITYTDFQERIIRTDRILDNKVVTTQYVYDDFGRQAYVIQPAYFDAANKPAYEIKETDIAFSRWVFAYQYDHRGRVIRKHIPGGGWTSIVYNESDQPVMTQSAEQTGREWNFIKYDVHGRIIQTGVLNDTARRSIWQGKVDSDPDLWETRMKNGGVEGYTNRAQPEIAANDVMRVNYYDNYDFTGSEKWSDADSRVHGLLTGSKVRILDSNDWLVTTLSYDDMCRLVHTVSDNAKGGKDRITNEYDFTGKLLSSKREHTGKEPVTLATVNKYDHAGRLLTVKQHIGGDTITVASNSYNALGQLVQTRHHEKPSAGTAAETVNYDYNIRGWLTGIEGDLFKERLHYQDPAGTFGTLVQGQWGGNISSVEWYAPKMNKYWHLYGYSYNELGFLTNSRYARSNTLSDNTYNTNKNHNDEWYTYDLNGNVKTLNRKHLNRYIDQLNFTYDGNRLGGMSDKTVIDPEKTNTGMIPITSLPAQGTYVSCGGYEITGNFLMEGQFTFEVDPSLCDAGVTGSTSYNYDASGRMIKDTQSGAGNTYNHLNLVKEVKKDGKTLKYTYDATGRKLKVTPPTGQARTYIDGIEYKGDAIEFITTPYGRIRKNGLNSWVYDYFLKDHLGNIRVVATTDPVNTQVYRATMEVSSSEEESQYFEKLDETRSDRPYNYPDVNPANAKVAKVAGKSEGPKLTLKVMAGDTISISAQAFYNIDRTLPTTGADIVPVVGSAIAALAGGAMVPAGEAASLALDLGATASTSVALSQLPQDRQVDEGTQPESGLHFVLYNEQMDVVEANTGILPVDDRINRIQDLSSDKIVIQESGYLEVFVNNDAQTPVYYDNLVVMQSTGNVIEVNAYYPYGKIIQGLSTSSTYGKNNYKYNGKELQTDMDLNWLDYGARPLPTSHPMWFMPDPLAEMYYNTSPYMYALGNPVNNIDPNGMFTTRFGAWLYKVFNGGGDILKDKGGEYFVSQQSSYNKEDGSGVQATRIFDRSGRAEGKDLKLEEYKENFIGNQRTAERLDQIGVSYTYTNNPRDAAWSWAKAGINTLMPNLIRVTTGIINTVKATKPPRNVGIVQLGRWGESRLAQVLNYSGIKPASPFKTSLGNRYIDRLVNGIAHEAKAGANVKLTRSIERQILKDIELIETGKVQGVQWHFFNGADRSVLNFLTNNSIPYIIH